MNRLAFTRLGGCLIASLLVFLYGCGPRAGGYPFRELDVPEQRVFNGFAFLRKERPVDAQIEFERALDLRPNYSPAYRGLGLVRGMQQDFSPAFEAMSRAEQYAENDLDRALAEVGMMGLYRMEKRQGWLAEAERRFDRALAMAHEPSEAYHELGLAYKEAYRLDDAKKAFTKVLDINKTLLNEAREEIETIKKIEKAGARSALGKQVLLVRRINRAETAGLLAEEFPLHLIRSQAGQGVGDALRTTPPDVLNHRMKEEILRVLRLNIRGLGVFPDGSFGAGLYMTRAGFATVMADLLVKGTGDFALTRKYVLAHSPFEDVRRDSPYFSDIMICYDWAGIMGGWGRYFHPMETISGVDALLILREAEKNLKRK
jgi:tetratricopeptide (TPR) repeat protein